MVHLKTTDILDLTQTSDLLPKVTHPRTGKEETFSIMRYLYSLTPKEVGKETVALFLSCQPSYTGGEHYITTSRRHAAEAETVVQSLGMYMIKEYGTTPAAADAIQKLLSDTGVERYHSTSWDAEGNCAIPPEEREQDEDLHTMEFEWGDWMDNESPGAPAGTTENGAVPTHRPLPRMTKETFDDKSVFTTASQLPLKAQLMEVDLEGGQDIPPSEEEAATTDEERATREKTDARLAAIQANRAAMQAKRAAARQALIDEQTALYQQASELRTFQDSVRDPEIDLHQARVTKQQELLMRMADVKVCADTATQDPDPGKEGLVVESLEETHKRMEEEDIQLAKFNELLKAESAARLELARAQQGVYEAQTTDVANHMEKLGPNPPADITSDDNHQQQPDGWEAHEDYYRDSGFGGSGDLNESMISETQPEHSGASAASSSSTDATDTVAGAGA
jgi:hypothetical protein